MEGPGFITVKFGDNKEQLFNSWCPCLTLLKSLQKKCFPKQGDKPSGERDQSILDLINLKGVIINLNEHAMMQEYAHHYIDPRETYVLIKIEIYGDDDEYIKYTSLLEDVDKFYPQVKAKLDSMSKTKPATTTSGGRWATIRTLSKLSALGKKVGVQPTVPERKSNSRRSSIAAEGGRKTPAKSRTKNKAKS